MDAAVNELRAVARQLVADQGTGADAGRYWTLIAELGWLMVNIPESDDGLGMGLAAECALHGELGRGLAPVHYLPAALAIAALVHGDAAGRDAWLAKLAAGEDYVAAPLGDCAVAPVDAEHLSGTVTAVPAADLASHVLAWTVDRDRVLLVPTAQAGVEVVPRETWDTSRRLFDLHLSGVKVEAQLSLASGEAAVQLVARLLAHRDFALAAEACGGAAALLVMTVEYLQTREQFGRPLAMFQALKHRCADLKAQVEAAQALLDGALARAVVDDLSAQAARQLAGATYAAVAEEALQLHGGIGMTSEHACHLYLKRAMLDEHLGRGQDNYALNLGDALLAQLP